MKKSNFYLTRDKIQNTVQMIIHRIKIERLPLYIKKVVLFGSFVKDKEKPHDIDILVVYDWYPKYHKENKEFLNARNVYQYLTRCLMGYSIYFNYCPEAITRKLLTKGMKGIDMKFTMTLDAFVETLASKERLLDEGVMLKVIWDDHWEEEEKLPILEQNPMKPYVEYIENTKDRCITDLNIDTVKILEFGNLIKYFDKDICHDDMGKIVEVFLADDKKIRNDKCKSK